MSDTIAAIATPPGEGGISVIRISGSGVLEIASVLFHPAGGPKFQNPTPRQVYFGEIRDPATGDCVDEVLLTYFQAPKSFTAEDVIEIGAHGGAYVTSRIFTLIVDQGARPADPGEFTKRAFLNGRLDLSQAEAVADLIAAASDKALKAAVSHLKGDLSRRLNGMYDRLLAALAQLEASIDFSEEGLKFQTRGEILQSIESVAEDLDGLIQTYRQGKIFREGARVTLVGKPNAGKSSLLNALLREDRAIVTPHPGTTRDTLEERVRIKDIHINIVDSAGLRENPEIIEEEGIRRTRAALETSDLALVLFDASRDLDANDRLLIDEVADKAKLILLNKWDLPQILDRDSLRPYFPEDDPIPMSAKDFSGIDDVCEAVYSFVIGREAREEAVVITRERHRDLLSQTRDALEKSCDSMKQNFSEEFVAVDVNIAMERLGSILGKTFEEDLLDKIFGDFCIGK